MKESKALDTLEFPDKPGVYIMRDAAGAPIYVGKAKSLKHRVRSYFTGEKDIKTRFLLSSMKEIETIITNTEYEALLLENNLIKQWKPRYNINLKDGKTYPVIRITAEKFPRVYRTRRIVFDGSQYFGPFPKPQRIDLYLRLIDRHFRLCKYRGSKPRAYPCLNYHMGRCSGACAGKIGREDYMKIVDGVRKLLSGKAEELLRELRGEMKAASEALDFEKAARVRDQIAAIEELSGDQRVMEFSEEDRDYVALSPSGDAYIAVVLQIREGKLLGKEVFRVEEYASEDEALAHFIARYYSEITTWPRSVYAPAPIDAQGLSAVLRETVGRKVDIAAPQRGKHARLLEMARENAREEAAKSRLGGETAIALERLGCILGLKSPPRRIEGFDIAHLGGADTVASMVSFRDGKPEKRLYRSFTIRSLKGSKIDDYEAIREAVARRYTRVLNEGLEKPDLILIDGGKGQLSAAKGILDGLGLEGVPIAGLAKKREEIFLPGSDAPILLEEGTPSLRILQAVRNESHRFATTLHKRKRAKHIGLELLERVPGIGRKRSRRLMEAFGSLEAILGESPKEVSRKSGIPMAAVEELLRLLSEALPMAGLEPDM